MNTTMKEFLKHKNVQNGIILLSIGLFSGLFIMELGSQQEDISIKIITAALGSTMILIGFITFTTLCLIELIIEKFKSLQDNYEHKQNFATK